MLARQRAEQSEENYEIPNGVEYEIPTDGPLVYVMKRTRFENPESSLHSFPFFWFSQMYSRQKENTKKYCFVADILLTINEIKDVACVFLRKRHCVRA